MTVKIQGDNSAASPGITGADTDTGVRMGTNELSLVTGGTNRVNVDSSGKVGIGTTSPTGSLQVGSASGSHVIITENVGVDINDGAINLYQATSTATANSFILSSDVGGTEVQKIRMTAGGNLVFANGGGIDFSATSDHAGVSSELLDDYEEGVYAATLTPDSGSIALNSNIQNLAYTKIGRLVHVQGFISVSSVSSPSGKVSLNLPFTRQTSLSHNAENGTTAIQVSNAGVDADRWTLNTGNGSEMFLVRTNRQNPTATDAGSSFSGDESITMSFTFITT